MEAQAFTTAMGAALNVPVCYPFEDFHRRPSSPTDQLLQDGPVLSTNVAAQMLNTAYGQLGAQAGHMLDTPSQVVPSKRWQSRNWVNV